MEPGEKPYLVIYDSVQRLNNPAIKKPLKVIRQEEMQAKIDEINEKDVNNRKTKKKKPQPKQ